MLLSAVLSSACSTRFLLSALLPVLVTAARRYARALFLVTVPSLSSGSACESMSC